jgi:hypothetical protein
VLWNWLPWKFVVRNIARARGFIDPIAVLSRLHRFAQPSEVSEPTELLRAGVVFHARGLMNSVIQYNLDWVWPFWVERQFDPKDPAFIPRAFSITHVNLTHRNWTALGMPDADQLPVVDPRGLVMPYWDSWSIDCWISSATGCLYPSRAVQSSQRLDLSSGGLAVVTSTAEAGLEVETRAEVVQEDGRLVLLQQCRFRSDRPAWGAVSLRPANPEGVSFLHELELSSNRKEWRIDKNARVELDPPAEGHRVSTYREGDCARLIGCDGEELGGSCNVGLLTAAALYRLEPGVERVVTFRVPLTPAVSHPVKMEDALAGCCRLEVPDPTMQRLFDTALRTVVVHAPLDVYPGPFTYRRFWFRDAAFILDALLAIGQVARVKRTLDTFPGRQTYAGYFRSQEGEWDSNGQALWIMDRYCQATGSVPESNWIQPIRRGAAWILSKRLDAAGTLHAGLLPAGFSAEHLGPSDYYYWDDFWGVAGLRAAANLLRRTGEGAEAAELDRAAEEFLSAIKSSLAWSSIAIRQAGIPASPYRRLDAGAIGSIVCSYPLTLLPPDEERVLETIGFLMKHCFLDGGFFQDMVHSGINPYLTLHVAQALLRSGNPQAFDLVRTVADLASPTGQWPEAIHPRTRGGCMGDGQHVWAAAEWILMMKNLFVREEGSRLIVGSGIPLEWLGAGNRLAIGPVSTVFGTISLEIHAHMDRIRVEIRARWTGPAPQVEVILPSGRTQLTPSEWMCADLPRATC